MNSEAGRGLDDAAYRLRSRAMTGGTRQTPRSGPAAVAVRDDGYVQPWRLVYGRLRDGNLTYCLLMMHEHVLSPPRTNNHKLLCNTKYKAKKICPLAFARRPDQRFHVIQVTLQRPPSRCRQPVFGFWQASVERFGAHDVIGFFQLAGMHAQVAVGSFQQRFQLVESQRAVYRQRADDPQPYSLVDQPVQIGRHGFSCRIPNGLQRSIPLARPL